jgi:hypothetical protein
MLIYILQKKFLNAKCIFSEVIFPCMLQGSYIKSCCVAHISHIKPEILLLDRITVISINIILIIIITSNERYKYCVSLL